MGNTLPQGRLDSKVLEYFLHGIREDLDLDLVLQNDDSTYRATREYGYSFFAMENGDFSYVTPPAYLEELGRAVCQSLGHETTSFSNFIISLYEPGFHLEPHVDVDPDRAAEYGFCFAENVYGVIIEADPTGHFYIVHQNGEVLLEVDEADGTTFCLQGAYRYFPYYHGVSEVSVRRISVTFRTVEIAD